MISELIVGCPVRDRAWILPHWFQHVAAATDKAGLRPHLLFIGDERELVQISTLSDRYQFTCTLLHADEPLEPYNRAWNIERYKQMVELRNRLLHHVKKFAPKYFWSLDSDILAHEDALVSAIDALSRFDAVGQRCYMTAQGTWCASYSNFTNGGLFRDDAAGCFPVDVIMASKVMSPRAYDIAYELDEQGEDIGWSRACARFGVKLGWDGRTVSKHVMAVEYLDPIDERCGF